MPTVKRFDNDKVLEFDVGDEHDCGHCHKNRNVPVAWSPAFEAWLDADCREGLTRSVIGYDTAARTLGVNQRVGVVEDDPCGAKRG